MKTKSFSVYALYLWLIIFSFIPLCLVIVVSLLSHDTMHLFSLPWTISNYHDLLTPLFAKIYCRSFLMALAATLGCLVLAYPFSYLLIKSKHQSILLLLIMIPFWTSSLIRTYALISILKFNGLLNLTLMKLHIIHTPLSLMYSDFAVMCGLIYNLFPFMVLPIFNQMERFNFQWIEAAKDLGANKLTVFFRIFLPLTANGIVSGCLLVFLPAMTLFYIPNVLGGARSILLGNMIQNQFLVFENWPQGAATSILLTLTLLLLLSFYRIKNAKKTD